MPTPTNVKFSEDGNILNISVDIFKDYGPSKTGKSNTVASTHGFATLDDGQTIFSLNVNRKFVGRAAA